MNFKDFVEIVKSFTSRIYANESSKYENVIKCVEDVKGGS
jgi:predicted site-specific integrase-resolvase